MVCKLRRICYPAYLVHRECLPGYPACSREWPMVVFSEFVCCSAALNVACWNTTRFTVGCFCRHCLACSMCNTGSKCVPASFSGGVYRTPLCCLWVDLYKFYPFLCASGCVKPGPRREVVVSLFWGRTSWCLIREDGTDGYTSCFDAKDSLTFFPRHLSLVAYFFNMGQVSGKPYHRDVPMVKLHQANVKLEKISNANATIKESCPPGDGLRLTRLKEVVSCDGKNRFVGTTVWKDDVLGTLQRGRVGWSWVPPFLRQL